MTRPTIIRADTIDLQDQDKPSAAAHQKRPSQDGIAPHQAAQVHHVIEERHSEEQVLANAWNISDNLTSNPNAIHQSQMDHQERQINGGHHSEDESDSGEAENDVEDDMMDRISSSPSIDEEDINFEFVYALHTFVATVEGQANATKGDTMVLLDDSNSYWWLVRIVKDSSIGYLPAEHIETPTERLARLNKHRNIDLAATMLSDNLEKSRNPLRKAMRRRNAKTVSFAPPTFVEASDYDYDTDEEDDEPEIDALGTQRTSEEASTAATSTAAAGAAATVGTADAAAGANSTDVQIDPATTSDVATQSEHARSDLELDANVHPEQKEKQSKRASFDREQAATATASSTDPQLSPRLIDQTEAAPLKSRKGTPRNTDSFLKDDSIETRKITLTPGLLREDNSSTKSDSSEVVRGNSLDAIVKQVSPPESITKKDSKREKKDQKKPSMLSGLFKSKKKDKKNKADGADQSDNEKLSAEIVRSDIAPTYVNPSTTTPMTTSPAMARSLAAVEALTTSWARPHDHATYPSPITPTQSMQAAQPATGPAFYAELEGSRVAAGETAEMEATNKADTQAPPETKQKENPLAPITNMLRSASAVAGKEPKPIKAKRSKQRVELDDFDSDADEYEVIPSNEPDESRETFLDHSALAKQDLKQDHSPAQGSLTITPQVKDNSTKDLSPVSNHTSIEDTDSTPTGSRSPLTAAATTADAPAHSETVASRNPSLDSTDTTSSSVLTPNNFSPGNVSQLSWSDSSLRSWLDDGSEVKDMLVMINDKSGVVPVDQDHPLMAGLFVEPRKGVESMMDQLDGLLSDYLQRKGIVLT